MVASDADHEARTIMLAVNDPIFLARWWPTTLRQEIYQWCRENGFAPYVDVVGPRSDRPRGDNLVWLVFDTPAAALMFRMRWL